jgi:hypothetical protein
MYQNQTHVKKLVKKLHNQYPVEYQLTAKRMTDQAWG